MTDTRTAGQGAAEVAPTREELAEALRACIEGMRYAEKYYLGAPNYSRAAEMWAFCNGYAGGINAPVVLARYDAAKGGDA